MTATSERPRLERLSEFLNRDLVKVCLSVLIIVSVLPENAFTRPIATELSVAFFLIFFFEFVIRTAVFFYARRETNAGFIDLLLLFADFVATMAFLPIEALFPPAKGLKTLRLFRLARMFLLFRYWGPVAREIWVILMKRKFQLLFAGSMVVMLSFAGGTLLSNLHEIEQDGGFSLTGMQNGYDYNEDGVIDAQDRRFRTTVWWSFRQIEDPGNLVREPRGGVILFLSLVLTLGGVFIISFVIGIGTNVVEELVDVSRGRPIGMRDHSAILNTSRSSHLLLNELQCYYQKHLRKARIAVLGATESKPDYLFRPELAGIRYRAGRPWVVQDLKKVDTERASRIILLGDPDESDSDASIVSQILSVRQLNPRGTILAELYDSSNLGAAKEAGGAQTFPIPMTRFAGLFLSNIVLYPGLEGVYRELLTSEGREIYTVMFGHKSVCPLSPELVVPKPFGELYRVAYERYGVVLMGVMSGPERSQQDPDEEPLPLLNPDPDRLVTHDVRGFIGLSNGFEELRSFSLDFAAGELPRATPGGPLNPAVPQLLLSADTARVEKILVSGFRKGLVEFVEQLILFLEDARLFVAVDNQQQVDAVLDSLATHSQRGAARGLTARGRFSRDGTNVVYRFEDPDHLPVTLEVFSGDALDECQLLDAGAGRFRLDELDMIVFTPQSGGSDPDSRTVLGVLKIWELQARRPELFKPSFRMIAEVSDPETGDLLEQWARKKARVGTSTRACTVLSQERIRNEFLAQAIFVPGISDIYTELLSLGGEDICRLEPSDGARDADLEMTFPELVRTLYERDRLILIGIELVDRETEHREFYLNPARGFPGYRFRLDEMVAVCTVGDTHGFEGRRH